VSAYEAGPTGYELHRQLLAMASSRAWWRRR
jgi:hypothetical protein